MWLETYGDTVTAKNTSHFLWDPLHIWGNHKGFVRCCWFSGVFISGYLRLFLCARSFKAPVFITASAEGSLDMFFFSLLIFREDKLLPRKVREAIFIKKETSPTLNRDGGRELSKIYDSLLETPRTRTPPTASSRSGSVSQNSATIRWGRRRVSPKYSDQKRECCWTVLIYF